MQTLLNILFPIDEARRYILDGREERLRLALVLLDNAAELQLYTRTRGDLEHEWHQERLHEAALKISENERSPSTQEAAKWVPLTTNEKAKILRYFDEKLHYLAQRRCIIDEATAEVVSYLHRYRNEAQHHATIRPETVRTAAALYFDLNCLLLIELGRRSTCSSIYEDYSWLSERFAVEPSTTTYESLLPDIVRQLTADILPRVEDVNLQMQQHLTSRVEEFWMSLDSIVSWVRSVKDRDEALKESVVASQSAPPWRVQPKPFRNGSARSVAELEALFEKLPDISGAGSRLEAFKAFSEIELRFEPIERCVLNFATDLADYIELEHDIARGK